MNNYNNNNYYNNNNNNQYYQNNPQNNNYNNYNNNYYNNNYPPSYNNNYNNNFQYNQQPFPCTIPASNFNNNLNNEPQLRGKKVLFRNKNDKILNHPHTLISSTINGKQCNICYRNLMNENCYNCQNCDIVLCNNCYERCKNSEQINFCPNNHGLILTKSINFRCDVCNQEFSGSVSMCCRNCNYDCCFNCFFNGLNKKDGGEVNVGKKGIQIRGRKFPVCGNSNHVAAQQVDMVPKYVKKNMNQK